VHADDGDRATGILDAPTSPDVALIRWPEDAATCRRLAAARRPRVLLITGSEPAPVSTDDLEDWVRLPVAPEELEVRVSTVAARARLGAGAARPTVDADGVLRTDRGWVPLPPLEQCLATELLTSAGQVVRREALARAGWPDAPPADPRAVDGVVNRLRRRIGPLGLVIHTVTGRGFLLDLPPA
jgi:DNA-binding response OmpR family regulator